MYATVASGQWDTWYSESATLPWQPLLKTVAIEASYYCSKERKLSELDALCSEQLLSLENDFLLHRLSNWLRPCKLFWALQATTNAALSSSSTRAPEPELEPSPSPQVSPRLTAPKSDNDMTAALVATVPNNTKRTTTWALNCRKNGLHIARKSAIYTTVYRTCFFIHYPQVWPLVNATYIRKLKPEVNFL